MIRGWGVERKKNMKAKAISLLVLLVVALVACGGARTHEAEGPDTFAPPNVTPAGHGFEYDLVVKEGEPSRLRIVPRKTSSPKLEKQPLMPGCERQGNVIVCDPKADKRTPSSTEKGKLPKREQPRNSVGVEIQLKGRTK